MYFKKMSSIILISIINLIVVLLFSFIVFAPDNLIENMSIISNDYFKNHNFRNKIHSFLDHKMENNIQYVNYEELINLITEVFKIYDIEPANYVSHIIQNGSGLSYEIFVAEIPKSLDPISVLSKLKDHSEYKNRGEIIYKVLLEIYNISHNYFNQYYKKTQKDLGFNNIYLVNLKQRPDRLEHMIEYLNCAYYLNFTLFSAIHGKTLNALYSENKTMPEISPESKLNYTLVRQAVINEMEKQKVDLENLENYRKVNISNACRGPECVYLSDVWNEVGCWQSHLHVYFQIRDKILAEGNDGPVLILEDDIMFADHFQTRLKYILPRLPNDWELFVAGHCFLKCDNSTIIRDLPEVCKVEEFSCTHGYFVRDLKTVLRLIDYFNTDYFQVADHVTHELTRNNTLKVYAAVPELITQQRYLFKSDIREIYE